MPVDLTDDMGAIRARLAAATAGPWRAKRAHWENSYNNAEWEHPEIWSIVAGSSEIKRNQGIFHPEDAEYTVDEISVVDIEYDRDYYSAGGAITREPDADLIAHAPSDLAFLLARVEQAEKRLAGVVELHRPIPYWALNDDGSADQYDDNNERREPLGNVCAECSAEHVEYDIQECEFDLSDSDAIAWPCPTVVLAREGQDTA
jgi:hypothetical protein